MFAVHNPPLLAKGDSETVDVMMIMLYNEENFSNVLSELRKIHKGEK